MNRSDPTWPVIDHQRRHIRTADDRTVIPFHVISTLACIAIVLLGVEATFGITNWISIPVTIAAAGWAIERCDRASIAYFIYQRHDDHEEQP